jgi:hypothetical protein
LAAGLPIVAPHEAVHGELLHPGINGLSSARFDAAGFARALERLILSEDLRRRMGLASRGLLQTRADAGWAIGQWELLIVDAAEMTRQDRSVEQAEDSIVPPAGPKGAASHAPSVHRPAPAV